MSEDFFSAEKIRQLRELGFEDRDEEELVRYLIAREGDVEAAAGRLQVATEFREKFDAFRFADQDEGLEKELFMKRMYMHYHTRAGFPLFVLTPANHYPKVSSPRELTRLVILCLDSACARAPKFDVIMDMKGLSVANADVDGVKQAITLLDAMYPERLSHFFFVNCNWLFRMAWSVVSGLVDARTLAKFTMVGDHAQLLEFVEPRCLPLAYGGESDFPYDPVPLEVGYDLGIWDGMDRIVEGGPEGDAEADEKEKKKQKKKKKKKKKKKAEDAAD